MRCVCFVPRPRSRVQYLAMVTALGLELFSGFPDRVAYPGCPSRAVCSYRVDFHGPPILASRPV
jgi:hypothetical protein